MRSPHTPGEVPTGARVLGAIGRGLIATGVVVLLFVVYQLWGTNLQEARAQDDLRDQFDDVVADAATQLAAVATGVDEDPEDAVVDAGALADEVDDEVDDDVDALPAPATTLPGGYTPELLRFFFPEDGDAVARIEIPAIGVDKIVVNGVQVADLRQGPGLYPGAAAVGTEGNSAIAGHRTTYGAPFNRIDELAPGDEIHVTGVLGRFTYRVLEPANAYPDQLPTVDAVGVGHVIVRPSATWVLDDFDDSRVTLTACHPKLSSRQRIIVAAELVDAPAEAPEFDIATVAAFIGAGDDDDGEPVIPGEDLSTVDAEDLIRQPSVAAGPVDLDEGLDGERDAIPGAVVWLLAATAIWVLAGVLGRRLFDGRRQRILVRAVSVAPVAFCLWFAFEMADRALPAG
jgi:sortase A